jgi:hypothetical protein
MQPQIQAGFDEALNQVPLKQSGNQKDAQRYLKTYHAHV